MIWSRRKWRGWSATASPHLGKRMVADHIENRSVFVLELLPQDLKIEIDRLTIKDAMKAASFLAGVVGKAHARQMNEATRKRWPRSWSVIDRKRWMLRVGFGRAWLH
jgi:uncharacterized protein (DUF2252 family)